MQASTVYMPIQYVVGLPRVPGPHVAWSEAIGLGFSTHDMQLLLITAKTEGRNTY